MITIPRAEVIFTAVAMLLSQIAGATGNFSHFDANALTVVSAGVFTAFEAIKDGWNKKQS